MKRAWFIIVVVCAVIFAGCGKSSGNKETDAGKDQGETPAAEQPAGTEKNGDTAYPPCVMVDGIVYKDTGYISSMIGCGTMDGKITSTVDETKLPSQNDQSNFGTGFDYQRGAENQIIVILDGEQRIFRNIEIDDASMPIGVMNFNAEVKEVCEDGRLLVTYISTAEGFMEMDAGDYYVETENLIDEVNSGDQVTIWFNGSIEETEPAQLGEVYRIEKTE